MNVISNIEMKIGRFSASDYMRNQTVVKYEFTSIETFECSYITYRPLSF